MEDGREWSSAVDSGSLQGILLACSACMEKLFLSLRRVFHTDLFVYGWSGISTLLRFLKDFLAYNVVSAFLGNERRKGREVKDAHAEQVLLEWRTPVLLPASFPFSCF